MLKGPVNEVVWRHTNGVGLDLEHNLLNITRHGGWVAILINELCNIYRRHTRIFKAGPIIIVSMKRTPAAATTIIMMIIRILIIIRNE